MSEEKFMDAVVLPSRPYWPGHAIKKIKELGKVQSRPDGAFCSLVARSLRAAGVGARKSELWAQEAAAEGEANWAAAAERHRIAHLVPQRKVESQSSKPVGSADGEIFDAVGGILGCDPDDVVHILADPLRVLGCLVGPNAKKCEELLADALPFRLAAGWDPGRIAAAGRLLATDLDWSM
jgi:hypothetical protein